MPLCTAIAVGISNAKKLFNFELTTLRRRLQTVSVKRWTSSYFITTPIFYVNAEPHIGHLYTVTIADAMARFRKLKDPTCQVRFMVGTDEHGLKVFKSAIGLGMDVRKFCDDVSEKYKTLFDEFNIRSDDFVRTTEERHINAVTRLWEKISAKDLIYKDTYEGWYCTSDEVFVSEHCLEPKTGETDVRYTSEDKKPVQFVREVNYKFRLSQFQNDLLHWIRSGDVVKPSIFQDILEKWIVDGNVLSDISLSRPAERVSWGIPVPGDPSQTIYVWFDALSSYLCSNGYPGSDFKWPPDVQVIGKDILKFHGVFWPAFLMAAGLEPPKCLLCHSHWLKDREKISKSKGNVINPFEEAKTYTNDGLRYILLREGVAHSDGNFSHSIASAILNSELADSLGNLLSRCTGSIVNPSQTFPILVEEDLKKYGGRHSDNLINSLIELQATVEKRFEEFNFHKGIESIIATIHLTNKFFDSEKPWTLRKSPEEKARLNYVLSLTMESLRVCGILLQPVIPTIADNLLSKLSIGKDKRTLRDIRPFSWDFKEDIRHLNLMPEKVLLFAKIKTVN